MFADLDVLDLRRLSWARVKRGIGAIANEFAKHDLLTYSSAIAFQVLYAVIPLVMLGLAALGIVGAQSVFTDHIAPTLQHDLSHDAFTIVDRTALKVMNKERAWWVTVGLIVTLWGVGASLRSMMTALNGIYGTRETRSWLRRLLVSVGGGAIVTACFYTALIVVLGGRLVDLTGFVAVLFTLARWLVALVFLLVAIATMLRLVPAKKRPITWVSLGSAISALCWLVATVGFAAYVSAVPYSSVYGGLATIVILLIYLHISAIAFLLGVVVDALTRKAVRSSR